MKIQLSPGVIVENTLKLDDLLCAFATELALHNAHEKRELIREARAHAKQMRDATDFDPGYGLFAHQLLDELSNALNELCPEGHYFGAHRDDGACFGVWLGEMDNDPPHIVEHDRIEYEEDKKL